MKIWYDACTGKHIRYGTAIARYFRRSGHEVIFTTRQHPDTLGLAHILGEEPLVIGKYDPSTLSSRLEESASRIIQFSKMFKNKPPDIAIAHQSVELCRTAFGLKIPIILTADTPHARAVNKLTIPFADALVISEALPSRFPKKYCQDKIIRFKGVDEVAWTKDLEKQKKSSFQKPLIIVREIETKATYAFDASNSTLKVAKKLESLGNVIILKRYDKKEKYVDSASVVANAALVVSAGGTIAREAALQGVPSIITSELGRTYVNTYLSRKGFPIFMCSPQEVLKLAKTHIGKRVEVTTKLAQFDNPVKKIEKAAMQIISSSRDNL